MYGVGSYGEVGSVSGGRLNSQKGIYAGRLIRVALRQWIMYPGNYGQCGMRYAIDLGK